MQLMFKIKCIAMFLCHHLIQLTVEKLEIVTLAVFIILNKIILGVNKIKFGSLTLSQTISVPHQVIFYNISPSYTPFTLALLIRRKPVSHPCERLDYKIESGSTN